MSLSVKTAEVGKLHLSRTTIVINGDGYIIGVRLRDGMMNKIEIFYITDEFTSGTSKSVMIVVLQTHYTLQQSDIEGYVPIGVVGSDSMAYSVFAKYI